MKIHGITHTLYLILVFGCASVQAESEKDSVSTVHFGKVNAIYAKESRMVIDDMSFRYNTGTKFYYASGSSTTGRTNNLKPGTPVKYHYYRKPPYWILKDLKIISSRELKESQKVTGER